MRGLVILLAACGSASSVAIEIETSDPAVTHVELFISTGTTCNGCEGIAPPQAMARPLGPVSYLFAPTRYTHAVEGGIAGFNLEPGNQNLQVAQLAAVGFDDHEQPHGFVLDAAGFDVASLLGQRRRYTLAARDVAMAQPPNAGGVIVWRAPNAAATDPSCLAIEGTTNSFLVPKADPDCDGIVDNECDANWYQYMDSADTPHPCLLDTMGECQLGKILGCVDGTPHVCNSDDHVCVPRAACSACTTGVDQACLATLTTDMAMTARLHCTIPVFDDKVSAAATVCPTMSNVIDFSTVFPGVCSAGFSQVGSLATFTTSIDVSQPGVTGQLAISDITSPCRLALQPALAVTMPPMAPFVVHGAFAITAPTKEILAMPIVLEFTKLPTTDSCVQPTQTVRMQCDVLPDETSDALWKCAQ